MLKTVNLGVLLLSPFVIASIDSFAPASSPATSTALASAARMKCRNSTVSKPLNFIDGRAVSNDSLSAIVKSDEEGGSKLANIEIVSVTCMNPADSTELPSGSPLAGIPVISVWTKSGPLVKLRETLASVHELQKVHFSSTGTYQRAQMPLSSLPAEVKVSFQSTTTGWNATAWLDRTFTPRCRVFGGSDKSGGLEGYPKVALPEGKVACQ